MPACSRLWCSTPGGEERGCKTQHMPWADGTPCGEGRWCLRSECVPRHEVRPQQDGAWGAWASWSSCSRSCGGGVRRSVRGCERPPPARGGLYCLGARLRYQSCSTRPCPSHQDFRAEQCRAYNGVSHNITDLPSGVSWRAKLTDCKSPHWPSLLLTNPLYLLSVALRAVLSLLPGGALQCLLPPGQPGG